MENMYVFRKMEVTGATKDEAFDKTPFTAPRDKWVNATQKFNNWKKANPTEPLTEARIRQFMNEYIEDKKIAPGVGCYIVVENAVADTRERPYRLNDIKNEKGARDWKTVFQVYENLGTAKEPVRGKLLIESAGFTKAEAKEKAKALYTEMGLTCNVVSYYTKQVVSGEPIAFTMEYTPSKSTRVGTYIVFGIEGI